MASVLSVFDAIAHINVVIYYYPDVVKLSSDLVGPNVHSQIQDTQGERDRGCWVFGDGDP